MPTPQFEIIVEHASIEVGRYTVVPGEYTIGRTSSSSIPIKVGPVSRRHARLLVNKSGLVQVHDLDSANGTLLDDTLISGLTAWLPGQPLRIGDATLVLRAIESTRSPDDYAPTLSPSECDGFEQPIAPQRPATHAVLESITISQEDAALIARHLLLKDGKRQQLNVEKELARGGMGAVLQTRESATRRIVAMKVMLRTDDAKATLRFIEEAQVTAQLEHPNIVPVHDLGVDEYGQPFYTMKLVSGIDLKKVLDLLKSRVPESVAKYPLGALLTLFQKIGDALAFAHSRGVIHRDLKPANIMLGRYGEVMVMDWGLAKIIGQETSATENEILNQATTVDGARRDEKDVFATLDGSVMGTAHYMSPEQARGEIDTLDTRSDIFTLGIILYELSTLERPFTGRTVAEIISRISEVKFIPPADRVRNLLRAERPLHLPDGEVPAGLDAIIRKALALDKAARYSNVTALQSDLAAYQNGFVTSAESKSAWKQFRLLIKRHKAASFGAVGVLLVGTVFGTGALVQGRRATRALVDLKKTAPALRQLAETEAKTQNFDSALHHLDAAIALDPSELSAYWRRAWLLIGKENFTEAAAVIRDVEAKDSAHRELAEVLPTVEQLADAGETVRWTSERAQVIYKHLQKVGAEGEVIALSKQLRLGSEEKVTLIRSRLDKWLGKDQGNVKVTDSGLIEVSGLGTTIQSLVPLHGLPINGLYIAGSAISDLGPLRAMPLTWINMGDTKVVSIEGLHGMRLTKIMVARCPISDWSPLQGMPLEEFAANGVPLKDLTFLAGAPLKRIEATGCGLIDISGLRGAPLKEAHLSMNAISTLEPLSNASLEMLDASQNPFVDLTPLKGQPLTFLDVGGCKVSNLSPLEEAPIVEMSVANSPIFEFRSVLKLTKLKSLRVSTDQRGLEVLRNHPSLSYMGMTEGGRVPYQPVAEFWREYDARQATKSEKR
jgi:serine/threonine protein kinase/pSer/pThr/pTyr-binding forkhead associated (FHA) protein